MIVYHPAEPARAKPLCSVRVAPAAEIHGEVPAEWTDDKGAPITIGVPFRFGRAEVPDNLGAFLVERGYARRTALILPPGH